MPIVSVRLNKHANFKKTVMPRPAYGNNNKQTFQNAKLTLKVAQARGVAITKYMLISGVDHGGTGGTSPPPRISGGGTVM